MQNKIECAETERVYYVPGSELIPIYASTLTDVRRLRAEHHEREVRRSILIAKSIKIA